MVPTDLRETVVQILCRHNKYNGPMVDEIMGVVTDGFTQGWDMCVSTMVRNEDPRPELRVAS